MIDMTSIQAAIGSLKAAGDIAKGMIQLKTTAEIQSKVIELQSIILAAQSSALAAQSDHFSLLEEKRKLEAKVAEIEAWKDETKRYYLRDYGGQTFAYELIEEYEEDSEPAHSICPTCYQKRQKSILQNKGIDAYSRSILYCPACKETFHLGIKGRPRV